MTSLTVFLKQLRLKHGNERLSDMARRLGISASYLSTIETHKRKMNDKLFEKITKIYELSGTETSELNVLRNLAAKELSVSLENMDDEKKERIVKFLSNINDMTSDDFKKISYLIDAKEDLE